GNTDLRCEARQVGRGDQLSARVCHRWIDGWQEADLWLVLPNRFIHDEMARERIGELRDRIGHAYAAEPLIGEALAARIDQDRNLRRRVAMWIGPEFIVGHRGFVVDVTVEFAEAADCRADG